MVKLIGLALLGVITLTACNTATTGDNMTPADNRTLDQKVKDLSPEDKAAYDQLHRLLPILQQEAEQAQQTANQQTLDKLEAARAKAISDNKTVIAVTNPTILEEQLNRLIRDYPYVTIPPNPTLDWIMQTYHDETAKPRELKPHSAGGFISDNTTPTEADAANLKLTEQGTPLSGVYKGYIAKLTDNGTVNYIKSP